MRVGIDCSRLLWVLSLFFATSLSYGRLEVRYPPSLPTSQAQQAYILELMHEFPWLASLGVANSLPQYVALQQTWLQNFYALPEFQTSKGITRQSLSIKVQTVHFEKKAIKVLSNEELGNIRNEVKEILHSDIRLHREIKEKIELLRNTDPRKVIIGLISLLPAQDRVVLFNLPVLKQIDAIAANGKINDQSIAEGFQPEAHNLSTADLSKTNILEYVSHLLHEEQTLVSLLRAAWVVHLLNRESTILRSIEEEDFVAVDHLIDAASPEIFDLSADENQKYAEAFFREIKYGADELSHNSKLLDRVFKLLKPSNRLEEIRNVAVTRDLFTIQEIIPELGVYRGILGGDCSTSNSYAFPFSPMERVFLVFDNTGTPMRFYVSGTILKVNGEPTFYLHDIAGPALNKELQGQVLHALYQARDEIGVAAISLASKAVRDANAGEEPSKSPALTALIADLDRYHTGQFIAHEYQDVAIRNFLGSLQASQHTYDSPQVNAKGHLFIPDEGILQRIQVVVKGKERNTVPAGDGTLAPREAFLRLIDLLAGEENPEMFFDGLGIERAETERILRVVNNTDRERLDHYYENMRVEFRKFDIELSEKFIKKNVRYFIFGHLQSSDAVQTPEPDLRARTVQFVLETLKRGRVRDFAYELIAANREFFNQDAKFREYVTSIPVRGDENLGRLERLMTAGIDPDLINWSRNGVVSIISSKKAVLLRLAIIWTSQFEKEQPTTEYLHLLAKSLDNEKHATDDTSLFAINKLIKIRTNDAEVIRSLAKSVKEERNIQIAYRAAFALLQNEIDNARAVQILTQNARNQAIAADLRERASELLRGFDAHGCEDSMSRRPRG